MKQSELKANKCRARIAWENLCEIVTISSFLETWSSRINKINFLSEFFLAPSDIRTSKDTMFNKVLARQGSSFLDRKRSIEFQRFWRSNISMCRSSRRSNDFYSTNSKTRWRINLSLFGSHIGAKSLRNCLYINHLSYRRFLNLSVEWLRFLWVRMRNSWVRLCFSSVHGEQTEHFLSQRVPQLSSKA